MFEDLRAAFREAIENFNKELSREQVPETVDKLIGGMVDEIASAKAHAASLEEQIAKTHAATERARTEAARYRRQGEMAAKIDDAETAKVATDFADKAEKHLAVLEQKGVALKAELDFMNAEVEQMMVKVKEAQAKKATLTATTGRSSARETLGAADDLFSELDRMAEKIDGTRSEADAAESMSGIDMGYDDPLDGRIDGSPPPAADPIDFDDRLAELKRRMGES